jgi:transcription elongation GreA/GreB family factor
MLKNGKTLKERLYQHCHQLLTERVTDAQNGMLAAQKDSNSETKSSAGDKYETGRAMAQLEKERHGRRRSETLDTLYVLEGIGLVEPEKEVALGSLVQTTQGLYFISVGLGRIELDGISYNIVSAESPIGMELLGLEVGDEFVVRGREHSILSID